MQRKKIVQPLNPDNYQPDEHPTAHDEFAEKNDVANAMALPPAPPPAVDDLPDDVKAQILGYDDIALENQLVDCIASCSPNGGLVIVDKIILALWYRHKRKVDRMKVIRTLNAMAAAGAIMKSESPRGYSLCPSTDPAMEA